MKNRKSIIALLLVAIIGIVGLTVAYFSNSTSITNEFETSEYGTDVIETFTSPTGWQPGDETPKVLTVKNTGGVDEAVRVKVEESWKSKNNTDLPLTQGNNAAAIINWTNTDDWTKVDVDGEDYYYYYYNYKLAPDEETSELLDKVTFNPLIDASTTCTTTTENGVTTKSCKSNGSGYDGATYTLKFTIETVQYNKYADAWGTNVSIAPTKEIVVFGLHVNPKSETYETGDKHQMFAFKHARTAQTPAQTDYRYIGDDPYNYVYFNCDNLENQNSETCEVWRIIGVFDVEREIDDEENPGQKKTITEQRMKLVRGNALDEMQWDNRNSELLSYGNNGKNDWNGSLMQTFLNEEYYNRTGDAATYGLKLSVKNLVEDAKFYLGGRSSSYPILPPWGTTEEIYEWERGTERYNDSRPINWEGKIALMYPSDLYMTYKGVSTICFDDPSQCNSNNSGRSWVKGIIGGTGWFLSPRIDHSATVMYVALFGDLGGAYGAPCHVNPVVYLKHDVKIIDGDGTSGNPYKLQ